MKVPFYRRDFSVTCNFLKKTASTIFTGNYIVITNI